MTHVYRLTTGQARALENRHFTRDMLFNPMQDADGRWYITPAQVAQCDVPQFAWVKTLPLVPYKPKPVDLSLYGITP